MILVRHLNTTFQSADTSLETDESSQINLLRHTEGRSRLWLAAADYCEERRISMYSTEHLQLLCLGLSLFLARPVFNPTW